MNFGEIDGRLTLKGLTIALLLLATPSAVALWWWGIPWPSSPELVLTIESGDGQAVLRCYSRPPSAPPLDCVSDRRGLQWQYQQRPVGTAFGRSWHNLRKDRIVGGLANGWAYSFRVRAISGSDGRIVVAPSAEASAVLPQTPPRQPDPERLLKMDIRTRICSGGAAVISAPIVFRRDQPDIDNPDDPEILRTLNEFFQDAEGPTSDRVHLIGFASPDGDTRHNENLSRLRVEAVARMVGELAVAGRRAPPTTVVHAWGEDHLSNGIATSRAVRLVSCVGSTPAGTE